MSKESWRNKAKEDLTWWDKYKIVFVFIVKGILPPVIGIIAYSWLFSILLNLPWPYVIAIYFLIVLTIPLLLTLVFLYVKWADKKGYWDDIMEYVLTVD